MSEAIPAAARRGSRRTIGALVAAQMLGGIGMGSALSVGALLAKEVSGSDAWSGAASTFTTLGAALLAVPLARLAVARGRGIALGAGAVLAGAGGALAILAGARSSLPVLILAFLLIGVSTAVGLQARFAAAEHAEPARRGLMLSTVMWATTVGAVAGPNLSGPGEALGLALGLPHLTGPFLFTVAAQAAATLIYLALVRPAPGGAADPDRPGARARGRVRAALRRSPVARRAIAAIGVSQFVMVMLMAMTPIHLVAHGASLEVVGLTISLHVAGMYAASPLFGWAADRLGRRAVILAGQAMFGAVAALVLAFPADRPALIAALILLGLGWSAAVIAGSAAVTEAIPVADRAAVQGASDLVMNACGAVGGAIGGPLLALLGFPPLTLVALIPVAGIVVSQLRGGAAGARG